ncbi:KR domain-containing protein [Streptomyces sp. NPDC032161]|uniref:KR domain-containing protein n=1 Tax=unclassified Streptomyces TaxID=2593676 RepID=UPI003410A673
MHDIAAHRYAPGAPVPLRTAEPRSWTLLGERLSAAADLRGTAPATAAPAVAVVLGETHGRRADVALLDGLALRRSRGWPLLLVHRGAGGASLLRAAALEEPGSPVAAVELTGPVPASALRRAAHAVLDPAFAWPDPPGRRRELHLGADGLARFHQWRPATLPTGAVPAGPGLVTGGLGGLGLRAATVLAVGGVTDITLLDVRTEDQLPYGDAEILRRLRARVPRLRVVTADVTRRADVARVLAGCAPATLVHCSGLVAGGPVGTSTADDLAALRAPKTTGLGHVLAAVPRESLRVLVGFGSITAHRAHRMMGGYALANELLRRQALTVAARLPGCAVVVAEWSLWSGAGQAHRMGVVAGAASQGMPPVPLRSGMAALRRLLAWPRGPEQAAAVLLTPTTDPDFPLRRFAYGAEAPPPAGVPISEK